MRYKGNILVFYEKLNGDIVGLGPHWYGVIVTLIVILSAVLIHVNVVIISNVTSTFVMMTLIIPEVAIGCLATLFLLLTALEDPGIIKPNHADVEELFEDSETAKFDQFKANIYCDVCEIYYPSQLRAIHCIDCNGKFYLNLALYNSKDSFS